ncbi:MAG: hypothetical protein GX537_01240 [Actinobacteria bacterium]|nr:hypothetical protein [Actinomycetota bacterium]
MFASPQDVDVEHQLTDLLLEALDLLVLGRLFILRPGPERVLTGGEELLLPALDLGDREAVLAGCLSRRGLALGDAE